jgi:deazaflavin-dependent oxidoreductase (nitroreductase family)
MQLPRAIGRFNKVVTNRIQGLWAPRLAPYAVVEHIGRTSGRQYSTPVLAWVDGDRLSIILTYGRHTDWVRNVRAAGAFGLIRRSRHHHVVEVRVVPSDSPDVARGARIPARFFDSVLIGRLVVD